MSFVANVKADFKALPQRLTSGVMPLFVFVTNMGLFVGTCYAMLEGDTNNNVPVVSLAIYLGFLGLFFLIIVHLILSQRLKVTLTIVFALLLLLQVGGPLYDAMTYGLSDDVVVERSVPTLWSVLNIIFIWGWKPKYSVSWQRRLSSSEKQQLYARVRSELESNNVDKGLWTQLWSKNKGNEEKTKAAYIKSRVSQLLDHVVDDETSITLTETTSWSIKDIVVFVGLVVLGLALITISVNSIVVVDLNDLTITGTTVSHLVDAYGRVDVPGVQIAFFASGLGFSALGVGIGLLLGVLLYSVMRGKRSKFSSRYFGCAAVFLLVLGISSSFSVLMAFQDAFMDLFPRESDPDLYEKLVHMNAIVDRNWQRFGTWPIVGMVIGGLSISWAVRKVNRLNWILLPVLAGPFPYCVGYLMVFGRQVAI